MNVGLQKPVTLSSDCHALLVPSGHPMVLTEGTEVTVTQALGDSVTVTYQGHMARISGEDVAALGEEYAQQVALPDLDPTTPLTERAWALLQTCYDPEIPVNIVDLGLIYAVHADEIEPGRQRVHVMMTLTAPGCGMGPVLVEEIKRKIMQQPDVADALVELVFDPPWDRSMMSEEAQLTLGMM